MDLHIDSIIKNKNVGILGFGREGKSTLEKVLKDGSAKSVCVYDMKDISTALPDGVLSCVGEGYLDSINDCDVVFKTPGVVLPKTREDYSCLITSEMEVFINRFREQIVGITGTKGKSTTSSLLYHVLKEAGREVVFGGNIGIPVFDLADSVKDDTIIVLEISCHQLEYINVSPRTAVLLNVYEDHLDHYGTRDKYGLAKKNIYAYQTEMDKLLSTKETIEEWGGANSEVYFVDRNILPFDSFESIGASIYGVHNLVNAAFVYKIVKDYGVDDRTFIDAVKSFKTLPHRLEYVGCFDGIDYVDDSISTTVKSAISAIESIKNASYILLGGMERNIAYEELVEYLYSCKLKGVVCMYESGKRIFDMYKEFEKTHVYKDRHPDIVCVNDLYEAVGFIKANATKGDACVLSPAAASYGYFKNFEERGDIFKNLVKK